MCLACCRGFVTWGLVNRPVSSPQPALSLLPSQPDGRKRTIDPLAPIDHSAIDYDEFGKDFYSEHPSIAAMSDAEVGNATAAAHNIIGTNLICSFKTRTLCASLQTDRCWLGAVCLHVCGITNGTGLVRIVCTPQSSQASSSSFSPGNLHKYTHPPRTRIFSPLSSVYSAALFPAPKPSSPLPHLA